MNKSSLAWLSSVVPAIAFVVLFAPSSDAAQLGFDRLYVFGDSLSDPGNLFDLSGGLFPPPPYEGGRTSNGPVWAEYLAADLGLSPARLLSAQANPLGAGQGINLAIAGASTDDANTNNTNPLKPAGTPPLPGLGSQLTAYQSFVNLAGPRATDKALYVVWAGANDYLGGGQTNPQIPLTNLGNALNQLYDSGARNFLVANLPDLGRTPLGNATAPGLLNGLTAAHNQGLSSLLDQFKLSRRDAHLVPFDVNATFAQVQQTPARFGFEQAETPCFTQRQLATNTLPNGAALAACGEASLFWDELHPTTKGHQLIANRARLALEAGGPTLPKPVTEPGAIASLLLLSGAAFFSLRVPRAHRQP